ncbi:MAG: DUF6265 family protein [Thermoanaerobaculia bacterium]|nr:DUF6265 family protein [Thermoanaerobaculia bacterium]
MRQPFIAILLAGLGLLFPGSASAGDTAAPLSRLSWLAGCWERTGEPVSSEEIWMAPAGGVMLGMSRTLKNGKVVETEFMEIREGEGRLIFTAWPSGQSKASFPSVELGDSSVLFANPAHDFPQRIGYEKNGAAALMAWIEGSRDGKTRRIPFPMTRADCPGAAGGR